MGSFRVFGIQVDGYRRKTGIVNIDSFQGESTYQTETDTPWPALERVPMVYICVTKIVNQILKLPRRVLNSKGEVVRSPTWIEDPNPLQSGDDMMSAGCDIASSGGSVLLPPHPSRGEQGSNARCW